MRYHSLRHPSPRTGPGSVTVSPPDRPPVGDDDADLDEVDRSKAVARMASRMQETTPARMQAEDAGEDAAEMDFIGSLLRAVISRMFNASPDGENVQAGWRIFRFKGRSGFYPLQQGFPSIKRPFEVSSAWMTCLTGCFRN